MKTKYMHAFFYLKLKLAANFEHVFLPTDNLQQFRVNLLV